jgi:glycosyltransferase involved in cell wall biosynthesis/predicted O-methyltransferase YrrM
LATAVRQGDEGALRNPETGGPRVSIGMPVYNEERFIRVGLDSLLAQTFEDFELIVSDNASGDATFRICQEYAERDRRVVLHRNESNLGPVPNFNLVLTMARAPYFMWAAADDRWAPDFIRVLFDELERHPEACVAMTALERVTVDGRTMDTVRFSGRDDPNQRGYYGMLKGLCSNRKYNLYLYGLFRTEFLRKAAPLFPETLGGDRLFLCQVAAATRLRYVDRVLYFKTRQLHHESSYAEANRGRGVHQRQILDLARLLARSPVIPWRRKLLLAPPTLVRYSAWTLGKAYGSKATWQLLSWYLDSDGVIMQHMKPRTKAGLLLGLLGAAGVLAAAGAWAGTVGAVVAGLWLCVLGALAANAQLVWRLRRNLALLAQRSDAGRAHLEALLATQARSLQRSVIAAVEASAQSLAHDVNAASERTAKQAEGLGAAVADAARQVEDSVKSAVGEAARQAGDNVDAAMGQATRQVEKHVDASVGEAARQVQDGARQVQDGVSAAVDRTARQVEENVNATLEQTARQMEDRVSTIVGVRAKRMEHHLDVSVGVAHKRTVARLTALMREIRYLTDLQVENGPEPPVSKDNPLSRYARERYEKHRRMIAFARNFEASRIRELYLSEIFPGIERVAVPLGAINELTGHANKVDMLYVCAIAKHLQARKIFEFGTYQGRTSYHLTYASEGAQVTTLNLPPEADPRYAPYLGSYFRGTEREAFVAQLLGDSRQLDTTPHRQQFDVVFVDGDHSYDVVKNDTEKAFELLRPGGAILWHDYAPKSEGLVEFFRDFTKERPLFRIKRTCVLLHLDGVDPLGFAAHPLPPSLEKESVDDDVYLIEELYHS